MEKATHKGEAVWARMVTPLIASSKAPGAATSLTMAHSSLLLSNLPSCFLAHLSAFSCERTVPRTLQVREVAQGYRTTRDACQVWCRGREGGREGGEEGKQGQLVLSHASP